MALDQRRFPRFARRHDRLLSTLAERLGAAPAEAAEQGLKAQDFRAARALLAEARPREATPRAWLLCHPDGQLVDFNAHAARLFGLRGLGDRLHGIGERLSASASGKEVLLLDATEGDYVILQAQRLPDRRIWQLDEAPAASSPWLRAMAVSSWGLTPGEIEVAEALLAGQTSEQIATASGRTLGTVRQIVKAILAKMHLGSQPQAVARLAALALAHARLDHAAEDFPARRRAPHAGGSEAPLVYWRYGEAGGHPLLFFHGALFGVAGRAEAAADARLFGFDVIAPERPGYGETPLAAGADPVALAVARARAVLDLEGIARVQLLAHDVGSVYAFAFARACPERVAGIICAPATPPMLGWSQTADMPPLHRVSAFAAQKAPALMETLVILGLRRAAREGVAAIPRLIFADSDHDREVMLHPSAHQLLEHLYRSVLEQQATGFIQDMFVTNRNWSDWLGTVSCPVTLLHGARSRTVSLQALRLMAGALPDAQLEVIADAGHTLPISHPTLALRAALRLQPRGAAG